MVHASVATPNHTTCKSDAIEVQFGLPDFSAILRYLRDLFVLLFLHFSLKNNFIDTHNEKDFGGWGEAERRSGHALTPQLRSVNRVL